MIKDWFKRTIIMNCKECDINKLINDNFTKLEHKWEEDTGHMLNRVIDKLSDLGPGIVKEMKEDNDIRIRTLVKDLRKTLDYILKELHDIKENQSTILKTQAEHTSILTRHDKEIKVIQEELITIKRKIA